MTGRAPARTQQVRTGQVIRTQRLTPHMVRVVLGGPGLADFPAGEHTDRYVKLLFPLPGVRYPEPFDIVRIRAGLPRQLWPATRTITVRRWEPAAGELTLDFVQHGDSGLAGAWAARARPGAEIRLLGPGGAYRPGPEADWHLLAGDESALPSIAAALERMPWGVPAHALIEVTGPEEELPLTASDGTVIHWLHRGGAVPGTLLIPAVRGLAFPAGRLQGFVHGEANMVKALRRHLRTERAVAREQLSISGYWRLGHDDEGWRASKKEWNARVEAEEESAVREAGERAERPEHAVVTSPRASG